ncbi:hypothetical protein EHO57_13930 [Leptospira langatensis]|uniref:Uncharacterized protein n=1 Tax=Leptospira langatensis TaxID=2484983 RepID=A0A5R2AST5_9LEPT|nr:hypothetical protein [Leptospira langatensis]TGJ99855.1 hypothetical protein EHO57_13930 [Leptospira langatensis]
MKILTPNRNITISATYYGERTDFKKKKFSFDVTIAYPQTVDDIDIGIAKRLGGAALESIRNSTYGYILATQTLNQIIEELPDEFDGIRNFEELDDREFIVELYNSYSKQEDAFHEAIKKNRHAGSPEGSGNRSRSIPDEGDEITSEGSPTPRGPGGASEEVHNGGDGSSGLPHDPTSDKSPKGTRGGKEKTSTRIPKRSESESGQYPEGRGKAFRRQADPNGGV